MRNKSFSAWIADWTVRRPWLLIAIAVLLTAASFWVVTQKRGFDSEILNLLPSEFNSVRGLKIYNQEFTSARELTFILETESDPEQLENFSDYFISQLKKQPWALRVFDRFPLESKEGREVLSTFMLPMMLNLDEVRFSKLLTLLQPEQIRTRLHRLRLQSEAGSPKAQLELENDPLGIFTIAASPLTDDASLENTFSLTTPDGLLKLVPVVSNQKDLDASTCADLMDSVHQLITQTRKDWGDSAPVVRVTGRSAYVAEISTSMQRDFIVTALVSMAVVVGFFYLGFRRVVPLVGIILLLSISSLIALAMGMLLIHQLNIIAMAFCSILFGLGDDFSLLLYASFQKALAQGKDRATAIRDCIREVAPGTFAVSITTGLGFLALCFSGSPGFAQLGILIAIGINICAACMIIFLPLFFFGNPTHFNSASTGKYFSAAITGTLKNARRSSVLGIIVFAGLAIIAILPWRNLQFDVSPHSLEPRDTPASVALQRIMEKFPDSMEPLLFILDSKNKEAAFEDNQKLVEILRTLKADGLVRSWAGPSAFCLSEKRMTENRKLLANSDITAVQNTVTEAGKTEGFSGTALVKTQELLQSLQPTASIPSAEEGWSKLPADSAWWFLTDRFLSPSSAKTVTFVNAVKGVSLATIEREVEARSQGIPLLLSGWSMTLHSLIPWAKHELLVFGGLVAGIIVIILGFIYRNLRLWTIHTLALILALGATVATLKFFNLNVNLLNVLAFPLMLAVGVDYGTHILLACKQAGNPADNLTSVIKPLVISAITTVAGFGSLLLAKNPSLSDFGMVCSIGVFWNLCGAIFFVLPVAAWCYLPRQARL
ncbi:MAG: MMPL family transporter [Chthoniobacterales bacterium]